MKVFQYISDLLLHHNCVIVPEFGGFIANHIPASINPVINSFAPPRKEILFNSSLKHNDGLLATYIAQKENISFDDALFIIKNFVEVCMQLIKTDGKIEISRVGTIILDKYDYFQFQPDQDQNLLLSSFGLNNFISPVIQRETIERRIEKAFSEKKTYSSERKKSGVLAKVAMISVPAAAIFVWAFINIGTISDVSNNYTNLTSIFSDNFFVKSKTVKIENKIKDESPATWDNPYNISYKKNIDKTDKNIAYPCISDNNIIPVTDTTTEKPATSGTTTQCGYYIIGSCNRNKEFAENYKSKLIEKGYKNANIIEPKGNDLFKVYIDCFDSEDAAQAEMKKIMNSENPNAWLLKM